MNRIVDAVIKLIGAQPTEDPCVFAIPADEIQQLKQEVNDNKSDEKKEEESLDKQPETSGVAGTLKQDNQTLTQN